MAISEADFHRLVSFVKQKYGIDLHEKKQLITSRLANTVKGMGFGGFTEYVDYLLKSGTGDDINALLSRLTTNYTYFMREVESFDYFTGTILPELVRAHQRDKTLSIWSAGCSSGEEPYNMTMYIMDYLGSQYSQWDTRILASDLSLEALNKAKAGVYQLPDTIPEKWRKQYFVPVKGKTDQYTVAPKVKQNVLFRQFNLMDPIQFRRKFDLIFCRNVMIYFDQPTKDALVRRFYDATVPGGYLVISKAENLSPDTPYRRVATSIFRKK
ncbi:MAG: protein-glutamate O-methyltransferase CheR [Acutalibacter sp.]|nr:protein-glutamate O-methyltransferase CheR [Acutalibacter sp.]MCI8921251.1 protein-glutamate O-methyltransferase CheR [Acutalibacter sp.]